MVSISSSLSSIALSGMQAAQLNLDTSANNIANANTPDYQHEIVAQQANAEGGVNAQVQTTGVQGDTLAADLVNQMQAKETYLASLAIIKAADQIAGKLLDTRA